MQQVVDVNAIHSGALAKAFERQRNDALNRECQKDALVAVLQAQLEHLTAKVKVAEAKVSELETQVEELAKAKQEPA